MKIKDVREMSPAELLKRRRELHEESFQLRLQQKSGQLENSARLREIRRDVARIETILKEKRVAAKAAVV